MKQTWIFVALLFIGLLMVGLACLSAILLGDFPLSQALAGMALSLVGAIGYRMAKRQASWWQSWGGNRMLTGPGISRTTHRHDFTE